MSRGGCSPSSPSSGYRADHQAPLRQFFTISPDPHQTHHLACSLELIPNWTFLATQRFVPIDPKVQQTPYYSGLRSKADELTETELDWIERGLELAQKYHPVAERRLVEMRSYRLAEKKRMELLAAEGGQSLALLLTPRPSLATS